MVTITSHKGAGVLSVKTRLWAGSLGFNSWLG